MMTCCHVRLCSAVLNYPHITPRHTTFISDCGRRQCDFSYLSTSGTPLLFLINLQSDLWCEHLDIFHTCGNFPPADIKTSAVESHRRSVFQHSTSLRWFQWRTTKVHVDPSKDLSSRKAPAPRSEVHTGVPFHLTKPRWSRKEMVWFQWCWSVFTPLRPVSVRMLFHTVSGAVKGCDCHTLCLCDFFFFLFLTDTYSSVLQSGSHPLGPTAHH